MKAKNSILMGCMAMIGLAFVSCSKDNLYDSNAAAKQVEAEYAANFVKKYGAIDPNQTWDFATTMTPSISLPSSGAPARVTRADNATFNDPALGHMSIEKEVIQYVWDNLPKGTNNTPLGRAFTMKTTGNSFTIVPIFQGCASYYWELWMWVDGLGHKKIWTKGDDFQFRKVGTTNWSTPGIGQEGMRRGSGPYEVYAPSYTYNIATKDLDMYFYLKVWTNHDHYLNFMNGSNQDADQPSYSTSLNNWMIDLQDAVKPQNLPEGNEVTIIGCEDKTISGSDRDFEDLVFMVYGNPVPPTKRVEEVIQEVGKRYMMEDLGDTDDFDFNDVVVDVVNRKHITYIYPSLEAVLPSDSTVVNLPQQAIVRAAGGTLDFTLTIGDKQWTKKDHYNPSTMLNTGWNGGTIDKDLELDRFEVTGWDPTTNNVSVDVNGRGDNLKEGVQTIVFPKKGEAPKIIAVEVTVPGMKERVEVPDTWFFE